MVVIKSRSNQKYEIMPDSEKDVKHPRKHSSVDPSIRYSLSAKHVLVTVPVAEDTAFVELTFRRGGVTINTKVSRKVSWSMIRAMKSNCQDDVIENYWVDWGSCFR